MGAGAFTGRVAVVTGGASGIGRAVCERFAGAGAAVAILDVDESSATEVATGLRSDTLVAVTDVADAAAVTSAFAAIDERFGRVDVLVNCAGIAYAPPDDGEEPIDPDLPIAITDGQWRRMIGAHLDGTFSCTRAAVHHMVGRGGGVVVNMGSVAGLSGGGMIHYSAAKAGILGFTRAVAQQVGRFGIRVNAVCPGLIDTPMTRASTSAAKDSVIARTPLGRIGTPADVANVVYWLASDESAFVTGQWISPNGGLLMQ